MFANGKNFQHIMILKLSQTNHAAIQHTLMILFNISFCELKCWDFFDCRFIKSLAPHPGRECYGGVLIFMLRGKEGEKPSQGVK
ncbi:hypothetical protein VIGAN_04308200 [Vigna angularis var. angularis]|uniref:Uncharacterized protein n=1 Tax=Vigna angularis var. angularis TaxID=157739 RepID=A0A0S3RY64_PHAAN|nr:hypothetical protein VIGAN_04308200 [Vigna angularis var. angularis]